MKNFEGMNTDELKELVRNAMKRVEEIGYTNGAYEKYVEYQSAWQDGYYKGLEEAWECAKKIYRMSAEKIIAIFGSCSNWVDFTAEEAIEKIRAYESKLNELDKEYEIQIGDEVRSIYGDKGYVTGIEGDELYVLYPDGTVGHSSKSTYAFTGKSNPLIKDILEQMKGVAE